LKTANDLAYQGSFANSAHDFSFNFPRPFLMRSRRLASFSFNSPHIPAAVGCTSQSTQAVSSIPFLLGWSSAQRRKSCDAIRSHRTTRPRGDGNSAVHDRSSSAGQPRFRFPKTSRAFIANKRLTPSRRAAYAPQQRLNFRPLAHGHGALRAHCAPFTIGDILSDSFAATSAKIPAAGAALFAPAGTPIKIGCGWFAALTRLRSISIPGS
jgi:hypothetical protein